MTRGHACLGWWGEVWCGVRPLRVACMEEVQRGVVLHTQVLHTHTHSRCITLQGGCCRRIPGGRQGG